MKCFDVFLFPAYIEESAMTAMIWMLFALFIVAVQAGDRYELSCPSSHPRLILKEYRIYRNPRNTNAGGTVTFAACCEEGYGIWATVDSGVGPFCCPIGSSVGGMGTIAKCNGRLDTVHSVRTIEFKKV